MAASKKDRVLASHKNTTPVQIPIPIEKKDKGFYRAVVICYWGTRNWEPVPGWDFYCPDIDEIILMPIGFEIYSAPVLKRLLSYLSPVGLLLVPGVFHDFAYRYGYLLICTNDGGVMKWSGRKGRRYWDEIYLKLEIMPMAFLTLIFLHGLHLSLGGWFAAEKPKEEVERGCTCV